MKVLTLPVNEFQENCHIAWDEASHEAAIIDCGANRPEEHSRIAQLVEQHKLIPKYALLTHCHFDHIMGLGFLYNTYGLLPMYHPCEENIFRAMPEMAAQFGLPFPADLPREFHALNPGSEIVLGTSTLRVIHTPGHTPGGLCFHCREANILFSGDTLFRGSLGRTDLGGNMEQELDSIRTHIFTLPGHTVVHTGHGPSTTVAWEKENNPYFRRGEDTFF